MNFILFCAQKKEKSARSRSPLFPFLCQSGTSACQIPQFSETALIGLLILIVALLVLRIALLVLTVVLLVLLILVVLLVVLILHFKLRFFAETSTEHNAVRQLSERISARKPHDSLCVKSRFLCRNAGVIPKYIWFSRPT